MRVYLWNRFPTDSTVIVCQKSLKIKLGKKEKKRSHAWIKLNLIYNSRDTCTSTYSDLYTTFKIDLDSQADNNKDKIN